LNSSSGGSDYSALQIVIVWLIKKYFERRNEKDIQFRNESLYHFSKNYTLPGDYDSKLHGISANFSRILKCNKAVKLYKRRELTKGASEDTRVRACLMEFGETFASKSNDHHSLVTNVTATTKSAKVQVAVSDLVGIQSALSNLSKFDTVELSGFEKQLAKVARESKREEAVCVFYLKMCKNLPIRRN